MNETERPAIGSSEAAVLTIVELIARAANMSEQHIAYWLDLYYQVRSRHETEDPDPVMARLDELGKRIGDLDCVVRDLQDVVSGMLTLPDYKNPGRTAWHSIVPPTPPDHYPPAPPRPAGRKEPDSVTVSLDELKGMVRNLEETIRREDGKPVNFKIYPVKKDNKQKWLEQAAAEAVDRTVNAIDVSAMLGNEQEQHGGDTPGAPAFAEKAEEEPTPDLRQVTPITADDVAQAEAVSRAVDEAIEKAAVGSKKNNR